MKKSIVIVTLACALAVIMGVFAVSQDKKGEDQQTDGQEEQVMQFATGGTLFSAGKKFDGAEGETLLSPLQEQVNQNRGGQRGESGEQGSV